MAELKHRPIGGSIDGFITRPYKPIDRSYVPHNQLVTQPKPTQNITSPIPNLPKPVTINPQPENYSQVLGPINIEDLDYTKTKRKAKKSKRKKIAISALSILLIGFGIGTYYGASILGSLNKTLHGNVFSDVNALFSNQKLKGEEKGRVNILLAGNSSDDPAHAGANLTDSIMIVSIDTIHHSGFMLSVPRDLWVDIPSLGYQKINAANEVSNFSENNYPSGGMGQLEQVVSSDLGIPINYYALIDYSAFKDAVNSVGGISINLQTSDPRGIYDAFAHLKLPNGINNLNGIEALNLARARGDASAGDRSYGLTDDFDRTQHQRQMLVALKQKALTAGFYTNPVKISNLFKSFTSNIHTDLTLQNILRLDQITKGLNINKLKSLTYSYGVPNSLLTDYRSANGQSSLIPADGIDSWGKIQQYYQQLVSNNPVVREAPSISILNSTNIDGLAGKFQKIFKQDGFNVQNATDANNNYQTTEIVDLSGGKKPASLNMLESILPKDTSIASTISANKQAKEGINFTSDFIVILGQDASNTQQP